MASAHSAPPLAEGLMVHIPAGPSSWQVMKPLHECISVQNDWVEFPQPRSTSRLNLCLSELSWWKLGKDTKHSFKPLTCQAFLTFHRQIHHRLRTTDKTKWAFVHHRQQLSELITPVAKSIALELWRSTFSFNEESSLKDYCHSVALCFNMEIKRLQSSYHLRSAVTNEKGWWAERLLPLKPHPWTSLLSLVKIWYLWCICPQTPHWIFNPDCFVFLPWRILTTFFWEQ